MKECSNLEVDRFGFIIIENCPECDVLFKYSPSGVKKLIKLIRCDYHIKNLTKQQTKQ